MAVRADDRQIRDPAIELTRDVARARIAGKQSVGMESERLHERRLPGTRPGA